MRALHAATCLAVQRDDAVNNKDAERATRLLSISEEHSSVAEELLEMITVEDTSMHHVLHDKLGVQLVAFRNRRET